MVPLTTYGQVTVLSEGHLPIAYLITLAAVFYRHELLPHDKRTSSFRICLFIRAKPWRHTRFLVGWAQLLDYLFLPIINYIAIGIFVHEAFPDIPMYVIICSTITIVSIMNILGIKLVSSMNMLIILMQFVFIAVFLYLSFKTSFVLDTDALLAPITVMSEQVSGLFAGAAVLCLAFLGFDAISTMAEETKDARSVTKSDSIHRVYRRYAICHHFLWCALGLPDVARFHS